MSERYSRLFSLEGEYYIMGAPIVVVAGALLKDNSNSSVLAQLKFKNISDKAIISVTACLELFDISGKRFPKEASHQYLDAVINPCDFYGQKEPINLDENTVRSFAIKNMLVVFADKTTWYSEKTEWTKIPAVEPISKKYVDSDSLAEYAETICSAAKNIPFEYADLWVCACGSINHKRNESCCSCKAKKVNVLSADSEELRKNHLYKKALNLFNDASDSNGEKANQAALLFESLDGWKDSATYQKEALERHRKLAEDYNARVLRDKELAENARIEEAKHRKRVIVGSVVGLCAFALVVAVVIILKAVIIPQNIYKSAIVLYEAKSYEEAKQQFEKNGDYKDSSEMIQLCEKYIAYNEALELLANSEYEEARKVFSRLPANFEDSSDRACDAAKAQFENYLSAKQYDSAIEYIEKTATNLSSSVKSILKQELDTQLDSEYAEVLSAAEKAMEKSILDAGVYLEAIPDCYVAKAELQKIYDEYADVCGRMVCDDYFEYISTIYRKDGNLYWKMSDCKKNGHSIKTPYEVYSHNRKETLYLFTGVYEIVNNKVYDKESDSFYLSFRRGTIEYSFDWPEFRKAFN